MLDRVAEIQAEAEAAIGAAAGTAELEELRVRYLGRKAELTTILRGIAELPQEERGKVGVRRQPGAQRARGTARAPRRRARCGRAGGPPERGSDRRHPAGGARPPARASTPDHPHDPPDRGRDDRPRLPGGRGTRDRARLLQLHRAQPPAGAPGADAPGHLLRPVASRPAAAYPHLACADSRDGGQGRRRSS